MPSHTTPPPTTPARKPYLLTVRSALIWTVALLCGVAAGAAAVLTLDDAHLALQILVAIGAGIGGTLATAAALNEVIDPGGR